jgi:hypothetical protein
MGTDEQRRIFEVHIPLVYILCTARIDHICCNTFMQCIDGTAVIASKAIVLLRTSSVSVYCADCSITAVSAMQ